MIIVGAGLSGLIAASMLRSEVSAVFEKQSSLPNNHNALLRFRSSVVGDAVGIPFRKVSVIKTSKVWRNEVADAISYSIKCTGKAEIRSVTSARGEIEERYIAPSDFISRLGKEIQGKVAFDQDISNALKNRIDGEPIISTIPMPVLMKVLGYQNKIDFESTSGTVISHTLPENFDICATVYLPSPEDIPYRVSITGRELIIEIGEIINKTHEVIAAITTACEALGIPKELHRDITIWAKYKEQKYAKISPTNENVRRDFIQWATREFGIYSLGRFACWRPKTLLDDIVNDVRVIQRMSYGENSTQYEMRKK